MSRECVGDSGGAGEIMLFGVRVVVDAMRKSVSMNNLSQYEQPQEEGSKVQNTVSVNNNNTREDVAAAASGYASADDAVPNSRSSRDRERKRGVPWTEEEHKLFLLGLQKVGKGDWRGISRNFVKTRTPTQVASHAQKYFLRRSNLNRRRRRTSLFDITTDTMQKLTRPEENSGQSGLFQAEVTATPMEAQGHHQDSASHSHPSFPPPAPTESCNFSGFPMMGAFPMTVGTAVVPIENPTLRQGNVEINAASSLKLVRPIPIHTASHASTISEHSSNSKSAVDPSSLTLKLSLPSDQRESPSRHSAFQAMPSFENGDSIITVA